MQYIEVYDVYDYDGTFVRCYELDEEEEAREMAKREGGYYEKAKIPLSIRKPI